MSDPNLSGDIGAFKFKVSVIGLTESSFLQLPNIRIAITDNIIALFILKYQSLITSKKYAISTIYIEYLTTVHHCQTLE